jgi:NAD(P)-dependent dehydrogenase (short-subunit alcohol dehydrogenase family)
MGRRTDFDLDRARAVVTGAGGTIGRAVARELARRGSLVVAVDRDLVAAQQAAAACAEVGPAARALACDVTDAGAVQALADRVQTELGPIDVLVNSADAGLHGRFTDMTVEDWRRVRAVNLDGAVHGCHAFGPGMLARGRGQVVNVSSGLGFVMRAAEPAYVSTKAAVLALSRCLRADWAPHGVGVSAVCPGVIATPDEPRRVVLRTADGTVKRRRAWTRRGHPAELVARDVVVAIRHDKAVVPVGWEATLGWWAHRFLPLDAQQLIARHAL